MSFKPILFITIFSGCSSLSVNSEYSNRYFQTSGITRVDLSKSRTYLESKYSEHSQCDSLKAIEKYGKYPPIRNQEDFIRNEELILSHSEFVKNLNVCLDKSLLNKFSLSTVNAMPEASSSSVGDAEIFEKHYSKDTIRYYLPSKQQRERLKKDGDYYINVSLLKLTGESHFGKSGSTLIVNTKQITIITTFDYLIYSLKKDTVIAGGRINVKNSLTESYPITENICNSLWWQIKTKLHSYNSK